MPQRLTDFVVMTEKHVILQGCVMVIYVTNESLSAARARRIQAELAAQESGGYGAG